MPANLITLPHFTGFLLFEYGLSGKWLELLKQIAPQMTPVGVIRDPTVAAGARYFGVIQAADRNSRTLRRRSTPRRDSRDASIDLSHIISPARPPRNLENEFPVELTVIAIR